METDPNKLDLTDTTSMLRYLVRRNEHGVWFITDADGAYITPPAWLIPYLEKAVPEPILL